MGGLEGKMEDSTTNQEYMSNMEYDVPARYEAANQAKLNIIVRQALFLL